MDAAARIVPAADMSTRIQKRFGLPHFVPAVTGADLRDGHLSLPPVGPRVLVTVQRLQWDALQPSKPVTDQKPLGQVHVWRRRSST